MHRELHAILIGLLVIVLASVAILFAVKKKASLETRYAFISADTGGPSTIAIVRLIAIKPIKTRRVSGFIGGQF
jgi:hypothetical protein